MKMLYRFLILLGFLLAGCADQDSPAGEPGETTDPAPAPAEAGETAAVPPFDEEAPLMPPELLEPDNEATVFEEKPLFRWSEVPGRGMYVVEIHQFEDMNAPAWSDYVDETSWRIPENLSGLQHGESYHWRVRRGMSDWSGTRSFTVDLRRE